jgi:uncharacterized protein (DUF1800 family)
MRPRLSRDAAFRLLGRAGYGARPGEAEALARQGLGAWLESQLAAPVVEPAVEAAIDALDLPGEEAGGPRTLRAPLAALAPLMDTSPEARLPPEARARPRLELQRATLLRKARAEGQLRERMVEFWHDHFNVSFQAGPRVAVALPEYDRRIRAEALGNFRTLLEATATAPAMLYYLNNQSSRAGAPNENYARELIELHTLGRAAYRGAAAEDAAVPKLPDGVAAFYVDGDVWEAARAFTGWSVAAGQVAEGQRRLPTDYSFAYVAPWHDGHRKQVLGQVLAPFAPAMADGRRVLDLLAFHPATARFVCGKLARFLIGDAAPAAQARAEAAFRAAREAPDQLARTVRALLEGPEILAPQAGRLRRPLDVVIAAVRAFDLPFAPNRALLGQMAAAGQVPFGWPAPDGQPLDAAPYLGASALRARWAMLAGLARPAGLAPSLAPLAGQPVAAVTTRLAEQALGPAAARPARVIAQLWTAEGGTPTPDAAALGRLAGWVLAAPEFQAT